MINGWTGLYTDEQLKFDELFKKYVPFCGMAKSVGGEILRCISKLVYRYCNDGDTICRYYGGMYNYLITANDFLRKNVEGYVSMYEYRHNDEYLPLLHKNVRTILNFLLEHMDLFHKENNYDFIEASHCEECRVIEEDWGDEDW